MNRKQIIELIQELVDKKSSFENSTIELEKNLSSLSLEDIKSSLMQCGVIPESFNHDSTEEKLYSKYTDILLAKAFNSLGIKSTVVKQRADSADVEGLTAEYSIVADAKAFRLSRTAKNQKDFKVEALNKWKKKKDFSCLVCPLYQYPRNSSQIYRQAIDRNVVLLAYVHLVYLLAQQDPNKKSYKELWNVGKKLKGAKNAGAYWTAVDKVISKIVNQPLSDLKTFKERELKALEITANYEKECLDNKIKTIKKMAHEEAINELIKISKLENKIAQIKKMIDQNK